MKKMKIAAVIGPTGVGKTRTGIFLAKIFGGEIISCDSMQVYDAMDIAGGKPTKEELKTVRHHLMGFVPPGEEYSVSRFVKDAEKAAEDIFSRGKVPILVGGTGLYIDSFIDGITFPEAKLDKALRQKLEDEYDSLGGEAMILKIGEDDPETAEKLSPNDKKRIVRALETFIETGVTKSEKDRRSKEKESRYDPFIIFLNFRDRQKLYERTDRRIDLMMSSGLLDEAREERETICRGTASQAIGHKELYAFLDGKESLDKALERLKRNTRRYAKRQITWFKKTENANTIYIDDYDSFEDALDEAARLMEKNGFVRKTYGED